MRTKTTKMTKRQLEKSIHRQVSCLTMSFLLRFHGTCVLGTRVNTILPAVHWTDPRGMLNHVRVDAYMEPLWDWPNRPLIPRVSVNHYAFAIPRVSKPREGVDIPWKHELGGGAPWTLELSVLPEELYDFAEWVASIALAHNDEDPSVILPPPHPLSPIAQEVYDSSYLWSQAAERVVDAFEAKRRRGCA